MKDLSVNRESRRRAVPPIHHPSSSPTGILVGVTVLCGPPRIAANELCTTMRRGGVRSVHNKNQQQAVTWRPMYPLPRSIGCLGNENHRQEHCDHESPPRYYPNRVFQHCFPRNYHRVSHPVHPSIRLLQIICIHCQISRFEHVLRYGVYLVLVAPDTYGMTL